MKGIEFNLNGVKFYHSSSTNLSHSLTDILFNKELSIQVNEIDFHEIKNNLELKICECLSNKDYFKTNRSWLSRVKIEEYKGVKYKLNLSEPKHYYFYELISIINILNSTKKVSLSVKFIE